VLHADGSPAGFAKARGLVHRDGDWHAALHIWVGGVAEDGTLFVVFQRRSLTKDTWPGALDVAVGGHVRAGETVTETLREAEEELGLSVHAQDLIPLGRRFVAGGRDGVIDREVQQVFAVRCDQPLERYRVHPDEVDALVALAVDDALALFRGERPTVSAVECARGGHPRLITLALEAFVVVADAYVEQSLRSLRQVLVGDTPRQFELRAT
jgi:isopentenyldiphosphate isomerase